MCHFITAVLPQGVKPESMAPLFEKHKLGFEVISNPHVSSQIETEDWSVLTTRGHCDCGTALGSLSRHASGEAVSYERELKRFRKQGWSEAKIKRWLEQKDQTNERYVRGDETRARGGTPELNQWVGFITNVLKSGGTRRISLLLHMYRGGVGSERMELLGKERVKLAELNPELLMRMKEDVLYEFVV